MLRDYASNGLVFTQQQIETLIVLRAGFDGTSVLSFMLAVTELAECRLKVKIFEADLFQDLIMPNLHLANARGIDE